MSQRLKDNDEIELGGRSLRVVHTPGHCCYYDEDRGLKIIITDIAIVVFKVINVSICDNKELKCITQFNFITS